MKGQSDTIPNRQIKSRGKTQVLYNIIQKDVMDTHTGTVRSIWEYDYVEVEGAVTKAKVMTAIQQSDNETDSSEIIPDDIVVQYTDAKNEFALSAITKITYAQADTYIDNNIIDLPSAKAYLKKLTRVVLAMLNSKDGFLIHDSKRGRN